MTHFDHSYPHLTYTGTNLFYHKAGGVTANEDAPLTVEAVYSGDNVPYTHQKQATKKRG